jgi:transcriptional regulator with GAF, ATPase, and Fis domain
MRFAKFLSRVRRYWFAAALLIYFSVSLYAFLSGKKDELIPVIVAGIVGGIVCASTMLQSKYRRYKVAKHYDRHLLRITGTLLEFQHGLVTRQEPHWDAELERVIKLLLTIASKIYEEFVGTPCNSSLLMPEESSLAQRLKIEMYCFETVTERQQFRSVPIVGSPSGYAFLSGNVVVWNRFNRARYLAHDDADTYCRSGMSVPLRFDNRSIGVFCVDCPREDGFSEEHEIFGQAIANAITGAIMTLKLRRAGYQENWRLAALESC